MTNFRSARLLGTLGFGLTIGTLGSPSPSPAGEPGASPAAAVAGGGFDLNGDSWADLVIGIPLEDLETTGSSIVNAGEVDVVFGGPSGLSSEPYTFLDQNTFGFQGEPEEGELFGNALAMADFDGDGSIDLAVGISNDNVGSISDAGSVQVLYSLSSALPTHTQLWNQNSLGIPDVSETGDLFGLALAAGDFNGDGFGDLAIGVPLEDVGLLVDAGVVHILYGSAAGLTASGTQLFSQNTVDIPNVAESGDLFGSALAAGEFGNGVWSDLAIGVPNEGIGTVEQAGAVHILYGGGRGLRANGSVLVTQDTPGVPNPAERFDRFGTRLAAANFGSTAHDDLAVGVPDEDVGTACCLNDQGAVIVLYGSATGLTATGSQFVHQNIPGVPDVAETSDNFGDALVGGDFNGDGIADLAVGVPDESVGTEAEAGAVHVFYGSPTGLTGAGTQFWTQDTPGLGSAAANSHFGRALAAGNFGQPDGDPDLGHGDLAIGTPGYAVFTIPSVQVLYGTSAGLSAVGNGIVYKSNFPFPPEYDNQFGSDLAAQ